MTLPTPITDAQAKSLKGAFIGRGLTREVYDVVGRPDLVMKIAHVASSAPNMLEWRIWNWVKGTDLEEVFAACETLSESHKYLFMRKATKPEDSHFASAPDLPTWHNDPKPDAFGVVDGKLKIIDYGMVRDEVISHALISAPRLAHHKTADLRLKALLDQK